VSDRQRNSVRLSDRVVVDGVEYETVGEDERVDREWEEQEAVRRREQFSKDRVGLNDWLRVTREKRPDGTPRPLSERVLNALVQIERMTTVRAGNIMALAASAEASEQQIGPPRADQLHTDRHLRVIESRIAQIERSIDEHLGLNAPLNTQAMMSHEKDREILRLEGWSPEDIHDAYPWLGSPRTIRKVRGEHDRRGSDGYEKTRRAAW
jgi:hypothetical protein